MAITLQLHHGLQTLRRLPLLTSQATRLAATRAIGRPAYVAGPSPAFQAVCSSLYGVSSRANSCRSFSSTTSATADSKPATRAAATSKPRKAGKARKTSKSGAKSKTTKKPAAKKSRAKGRKPKPKPRQLSEKAKARKEAAKKNATIRALRQEALKLPAELPSTAFTLVTVDMSKSGQGIQGRAAADKYRSLDTSERQRLDYRAAENKSKNVLAYRTFVRSKTPEEIRLANLARRRLSRLGVPGYKRSIRDDRQVKGPSSALTFYIKEALSNTQGSSVEPFKEAVQHWRSMSESEKQRFKGLEAEDRQRYTREVKEVYGRDVSAVGKSKSTRTRATKAA